MNGKSLLETVMMPARGLMAVGSRLLPSQAALWERSLSTLNLPVLRKKLL